MQPSYLGLYRKGELSNRLNRLLDVLKSCNLCPHECGVNRIEGKTGFCKIGRKARVAGCNAHFGEESPLVGKKGSGTIFLSSCNLRCHFCQNYEISHHREGVDVETKDLAAMMLELEKRGCHNINFVTPTHVVPQLLEALVIAAGKGLSVPLVYNCGGYEKVETLKILDGIFDVYMPDFKFWDNRWSKKYCEVEDYRERAKAAIKEMHRQVGDLLTDDRGIAIRGLIIRHLVMPNKVAGTSEVMEFIAQEISKNAYVNIMDQYRPCGDVVEDTIIHRRLTSDEYRDAVESARNAGIMRLDPGERARLFF